MFIMLKQLLRNDASLRSEANFNVSSLVCADLACRVCDESFLCYCSVSGFLSAFLAVLSLPYT